MARKQKTEKTKPPPRHTSPFKRSHIQVRRGSFILSVDKAMSPHQKFSKISSLVCSLSLIFLFPRHGQIEGYAPSAAPSIVRPLLKNVGPDAFTTLGTMEVPKIAVGTISWSGLNDESAARRLIHECKSKGLSFFDTAERYTLDKRKEVFGLGWGANERAFAGADGVAVATKFTPAPTRTTAASVVDACKASRERIHPNSDRPIDLYQIHMPDIVKPYTKLFNLPSATHDKQYWEGLVQCHELGLVDNVGVSNYGSSLLLEANEYLQKRTNNRLSIASNQINYSLLYNTAGVQSTVKTCRDLGVKTLGYTPLALGLLSGKYEYSRILMDRNSYGLQDLTLDQISATFGLPIFQPTSYSVSSLSDASTLNNNRSFLERRDLASYDVTSLIAEMVKLGVKYQKTIAQVAVAWVTSQGIVPVVGVRTERHALAMADALSFSLTPDEVSHLTLTSSHLPFDQFDGAGFKLSSGKFVGYGVEEWRLD